MLRRKLHLKSDIFKYTIVDSILQRPSCQWFMWKLTRLANGHRPFTIVFCISPSISITNMSAAIVHWEIWASSIFRPSFVLTALVRENYNRSKSHDSGNHVEWIVLGWYNHAGNQKYFQLIIPACSFKLITWAFPFAKWERTAIISASTMAIRETCWEKQIISMAKRCWCSSKRMICAKILVGESTEMATRWQHRQNCVFMVYV